MNSLTDKNVSLIDPWQIEIKTPDIPMPLPCRLSFAPLIKILGEGYDTGSPSTNRRNQDIATLAGSIPELLQPISTSEAFSRHGDTIAALMGAIFPVNFGQAVAFAAIFPFQPSGFWTSKMFADIFLSDQGHFLGCPSECGKSPKYSMMLDLYKFVLADGFGLGAAVRHTSELFEVKRHETGLMSFHRMYLDLSYCVVKIEDKPKNLAPELIDKVFRSINDVEELMRIFPLDGIAIEGFTIVRSFDVTQQEAFSRIKQLLLSEHNNHAERGQELENLLRILCGDPSLRIGLFIEFEDKLLQSLGLGIHPQDVRPVWYDLGVELDLQTLEGSAHQKVLEQKFPQK